MVKAYRRKLSNTSFDRLDQYCSDFFGWLANNTLFSTSIVDDIIETNLIRKFVDLTKGVKSKADFANNIQKEITELNKYDYIDGLDAGSAKTLSKTYRKVIDGVTSGLLKKSHIRGQKKQIDELSGLLLAKKRRLPGYSGIVIAGFGDQEPLPKLKEYIVDIVVDGRVRYWQLNEYHVDERNQSEVVPLADAEVIRTLTEGISPGFENEAYRGALKLILSLPKTVLDPVVELTDAQKQTYIEQARQALPKHFSDFYDNMTKYRRETYTQPIKQAISSLPISELAAVAETFLGASQIQKRVSPELETVGGPVDVAVISKGDGFVWIKRKHYFEEKFNPAFKLKYLEQ